MVEEKYGLTVRGDVSPERGSVLHVPFTYFPDACGGTEVYVQALARCLSGIGYPSSIAAPGATFACYRHNDLNVHRFATDNHARLELAYGVADEIAADGFRTIVERLEPNIVHLHARTSAVSERLVDIAHAVGARVVFTYHTPTASCARGTMMLFGKRPCDGHLQRQRCSACALAGHGVPKLLGTLGAYIPDGLSAWLAYASGGAKTIAALQIPSMIDAAHGRFRKLMSKVDHVVAVCHWVHDVLVLNGVPPLKITLSRQGTTNDALRPIPVSSRSALEPLKLAYFGRIDRAKGPDLLVRALNLIPTANVHLDIFAINQSDQNAELVWLASQARRDNRLTVRLPVPPEAVRATMSGYDMIAVPSRGLETGPLVVLEAFAAGIPVLGAALGGITELVRDGVDGVLVKPDAPKAWAYTLAGLARQPEHIEALRRNIRPPRTVNEVAADMAVIYQRLAGDGIAQKL